MKITKFLALLCAASMFAVGCDKTPDEPDGPKPTGDIVLTATPATGEVGQPITFTVTSNGVDVTESSEIFNSKTYDKVENPFTPTIDGEYSFYAVNGAAVSPVCKVTVTAEVPELAEDTDKANTAFKHRILIVDHTGTQCGWCPYVMDALHQLGEGDYGDRFHEAMAHTYNASDPSYSAGAMQVSNAIKRNSGYPDTNVNFYVGVNNLGADITGWISAFKNQIDKVWQAEGANAGISIATVETSDSVLVNLEVKAAKEDDYRVACWLLEDDVYGKQSGAYETWQNTHSNGIRNITGVRNNADISGDDLGKIAKGATAQKVVNIPIISTKWVRENLKVLVIVTAKNSSGKYDVVNTAVCPINEKVGYDYL